jgi:mono/diheme cytochrome c family protein
MTLKYPFLLAFAMTALSGCATETSTDRQPDYEELDSATLLDSPDPVVGRYHPADKDTVDRGAYMIELLACGACHTNGAFEGDPDIDRSLAGSSTGIAFTNPLGDKFPGVIYPPNITPDEETGIGKWSDRQIANAICAGIGRHGERRIPSMPWQGYARLSDDDVAAVVAYLRSIEPIRNAVPKEVKPGDRATSPFVYFGVYRSTE